MGKKAKERKRREREALASMGVVREPSIAKAVQPARPNVAAPPGKAVTAKAPVAAKVKAPAAAKPLATAPAAIKAPAAASAKPKATRPAAVKAPSATAAKPVAAAKSPAAKSPAAKSKPGNANPAVATAAKPPAAAKSKPSVANPPAEPAAPVSRIQLSGQLATRLNSVAIHLLRRLQREDTRLGLSGARLSALSVLVFGGPRTLGKLADAEGVSPPSMTRLVTAMETDGLVVREKNAADGRSVIIKASAEGERILIRGREQRVHALAGWLSHLSQAGLLRLDEATSTLETLLKNQRTDSAEAKNRDKKA
jgi:DNA-binding MarR family transcriptional regulator